MIHTDFKETRYNYFCVYLISEEELARGRLLTVIPWMSTEWTVSFTIRLTSLASSDTSCNIIKLTNENSHQYGVRIPAVFLRGNPTREKISFSSAINGNHNYNTLSTKGLAVNAPIHIEIHQRYVSGGKYRYFIKINGEEIHSIINTDARQFYNVKVYASNELATGCIGYIKNLYITNFL